MNEGTSRYLIDERPLTIQPTLVKVFGFERAAILQQFHWLLGQPRTGIEHEGQKWIWGTYEQWCADYFTFWPARTLRYHMSKLIKTGVLITSQLRKSEWDRTNYYTIDYNKLDLSIRQDVDTSMGQSIDASNRQCTDASIRQPIAGSYRGTNKTTNKTTERERGEPSDQADKSTNTATAPAPAPNAIADESFDGPTDKTPKVPTNGQVKRSEQLDIRKLQGGLIPEGQGSTPIEVYHESFSTRHALSRSQQKAITRAADLDRWRIVVTAWSLAGNKPGNVAGMLDWYDDPTRLPSNRHRNGNSPPPTLQDLTFNDWLLRTYNSDMPTVIGKTKSVLTAEWQAATQGKDKA